MTEARLKNQLITPIFHSTPFPASTCSQLQHPWPPQVMSLETLNSWGVTPGTLGPCSSIWVDLGLAWSIPFVDETSQQITVTSPLGTCQRQLHSTSIAHFQDSAFSSPLIFRGTVNNKELVILEGTLPTGGQKAAGNREGDIWTGILNCYSGSPIFKPPQTKQSAKDTNFFLQLGIHTPDSGVQCFVHGWGN